MFGPILFIIYSHWNQQRNQCENHTHVYLKLSTNLCFREIRSKLIESKTNFSSFPSDGFCGLTIVECKRCSVQNHFHAIHVPTKLNSGEMWLAKQIAKAFVTNFLFFVFARIEHGKHQMCLCTAAKKLNGYIEQTTAKNFALKLSFCARLLLSCLVAQKKHVAL